MGHQKLNKTLNLTVR